MKLISCQLKCGKNKKETKLIVSNLKVQRIYTSKVRNLDKGIKLAPCKLCKGIKLAPCKLCKGIKLAPCKLCIEHLWGEIYKTNQTKLMYLDFIKKIDVFGIKLAGLSQSINSCSI
jgi:hypothetical protein